ncbi:MAG: 4Fe-4S dicluster domain-containing protein [Candidatus Bathyarchaeia archaeon]
MTKWTMIVDVSKCNGCYNCFLACKDEFWNNDYPPYSMAQPRHGHQWIRILTKEHGQYPHVRVAYMPITCMHCDEAPCIENAKNNAVYKRPDGVVIIDPEKAYNQKQILDTCPYKAIFWNEEKKLPQKCTLCAHLLDKGWKEPRCVQACPTGALIFGDLENSKSDVYKKLVQRKAEPYRPEYGTKPNIHYIALHKITKNILAGTVVFKDTDECAENVKITLINKKTNQLKNTQTNNYGDFEIQELEPAEYTLILTHPNYKTEKMDIKIERSTYIGCIFLEKSKSTLP